MAGKIMPLGVAVLVALALGGGITVAPQAQDAGPRVLPPARIDWLTMSRVYNRDVAAKNRSTPALRRAADQIDTTTLPILLPDASTGVSRDQLKFTSLGDVYDVNLAQPVNGLTVLLSGTRVFVAAQPGLTTGVKLDQVNMGGQPVEVLFSQTEDGWLASFARFGMSYTVEVICDEAAAMSYCANSTYIRKIAAGMTEIVLGAAAEREFAAAANGGNTPPPDTRKPPRVVDKVTVPVNRDVLKRPTDANTAKPISSVKPNSPVQP